MIDAGLDSFLPESMPALSSTSQLNGVSHLPGKDFFQENKVNLSRHEK